MAVTAKVKIRALSKSQGREDVNGITIPAEVLAAAGWVPGDVVKIETRKRTATDGTVFLTVTRLQ